MEVGVATWHAIGTHRHLREASKKASIKNYFKSEWCCNGIFGSEDLCHPLASSTAILFYEFRKTSKLWACSPLPVSGFHLKSHAFGMISGVLGFMS